MKILLSLSTDSSRDDARRLAVETARDAGGEVRGLFVVDLPGIERSEAGAPPGAIQIARRAGEEIASQLGAAGAAAVEAAGRACGEAGVPFAGEVAAGDPRRVIEVACAASDLLVSGLSSRYAHDGGDEPGSLVLSLMKDKVVPVLLACSPCRPVKTVVVGCGGGDRTSRAVGAMAHLGLWKGGCRVVLLAVAASPAEGEARLADPRRALADAGYTGVEEKIVPGPKADAFSAFCEAEAADAVVLGGFGERRWDDLLGRSVTVRLLAGGRVHLFLRM
ncbi:MAG: hypothetical protein ACM3NF_01140 [Gemmatimonadota bacterium]